MVQHSGPAVYRSEDLAPTPITTAEPTSSGDPGAVAIRQRLREAALRAQLDPALVEAVKAHPRVAAWYAR